MKVKGLRACFSTMIFPRWIILLIDVFIILVSFVLSSCVRFDFNLFSSGFQTLGEGLLLVLFVNIFFFSVFKTYSGVLRYSSFIDIVRLFVTLSFSYATLFIIDLFFLWINGVHLIAGSVLFISYTLGLILLSGLRIIVKMYFEYSDSGRKDVIRVMIYGKKGSAVNIASMLQSGKTKRYRICGFIADEPDLIGKNLMGLMVYPNDESLPDILGCKGIDTIIVDPGKMEKVHFSGIADSLLMRKIKLLTLSSVTNLKDSIKDVQSLKEIQIEDLLQRKPVEVDIRKIASHLQGKCVMITGAAGSIGSEIVRQVAAFHPRAMILIDQAETPMHDVRLELQDGWQGISAVTIVADITNFSRMESIFKRHRPQYIFHAAAYKHVPMMENNVSESIQVNVMGTCNIADLAVKYNTEKFVMISTDKAVNPTNVMGASKRIAEIYVQSLAKKLKNEGDSSVKFITTRFGNVLGSNGSVIPRFKVQIEKGGPVTVTHPEIMRYFMTIPEACRLVLEAGSMGEGGEIYIFDMGKPVKILDLAKRMISLAGYIPGKDIKIEFTGLRHGEKLYEELLNIKELCKPTHHEKILIASVVEYNYEEANAEIRKLISDSYACNQMQVVADMKNIVPEFISKNSCFEQLDKNSNNLKRNVSIKV